MVACPLCPIVLALFKKESDADTLSFFLSFFMCFPFQICVLVYVMSLMVFVKTDDYIQWNVFIFHAINAKASTTWLSGTVSELMSEHEVD